MDQVSGDIISKLQGNIKLLQERHEQLKKDYQMMEDSKEKLKQEIIAKKNKISELEEKYKTLQLAKSFSDVHSDSHDARIRVNKIVREIDKCIALLNK